MSRRSADLATLANALCGVGAVLYILAGNPRWGGLLIVCGLGFDGLDGYLSRRAGGPPSVFGRIADSLADAVSFGIAPAVLIAVHTANRAAWAPWGTAADAVAGLLLVLALARLTYFTLHGHRRSNFVGVPTPQTALAVVALVLWFDVPGFLGVAPGLVLAGSAVAAVMMVVPLPYPKLRRGARINGAMTITGVALVAAELPIQFRPGNGSALGIFSELALLVASVGLLVYYVFGPSSVLPRAPPVGEPDA